MPPAAEQPSGAEGPQRQTSSQRRELIRDRVVESGSVRNDALAAELGVTVMTIHRDLNALEGQGWVRKIRGGAVIDSSASIDTTVRHRLGLMLEEKEQIARAALEHLHAADAVMIDDSTTALQVAKLLPGRGHRTVITNFLMAINALAEQTEIDLIALGGTYDATYQAFHGLHVREMISKLRADVLYMSTTAILDGFLYHKSQETILIRHAMMESAARRILLVDHTKFQRRAVHQFAALTDFDVVIVDGHVPAEDVAVMRERGANVQVAGAPGPGAQEPAGGGAPSPAE
jgi:DeoR/GlpR family transcriptional regulator of sugar metabolism